MKEKEKEGGALLRTSVPHRTAQLVDYTPGGTVSREIAKTDGGTVTLFAFDEGQGLSEHSAPFDALVHVLEGTVRLTIGGEQVEAGKGELVVMPRDIPHAVHAPTRFKMLLVMLKGDQDR